MTLPTRLLIAGLFGLALLFAFWFSHDPVALAVFAAPPLLLIAFNWKGDDRPAFWAGLLALLWFSHGVMVAWSRPAERELALVEVALSLLVVLAASTPGLRARFGKKR